MTMMRVCMRLQSTYDGDSLNAMTAVLGKFIYKQVVGSGADIVDYWNGLRRYI